MTDKEGLLRRALGISVAELQRDSLQPLSVAVLDSGIDGSHPDLKGRIVKAVLCEADAEGNVSLTDADPEANNDLYGHGTGVASIIARIAPHVSIFDVRVLGGNNRGSGEALIAGLRYALRNSAHLINMSLAISEKYLPRLSPLCETAYRRGIPIIAARRNLPLQDEGFPAALIPCVGVDNAGKGAEGEWRYRRDIIEYSAHGVDVPVAAAGGGYTTMTGTSFATPIMCGHVALLMGAYPGLTPFEIKTLLKAFAITA